VRRIISALLVFVMLFAFAAVPIFVIVHSGHSCHGELCSLCPFILEKQRIFELFGRFAVIGFSLLTLYLTQVIGIRAGESRKCLLSLTEANVRMNN
jgi:hypothetical protein